MDAYSKQRSTALLRHTPRRVQHCAYSSPAQSTPKYCAGVQYSEMILLAGAVCPPKYIGREMYASCLSQSLTFKRGLPENYYCLLIALPVTIIG